MVAPCFFGTESTLNFEVKRLGAQNIQVTDGRVAFQGGADVIAAANLNLRTAERVLLLLATYKATTFDELFDGCYNIAWEDLLPANAAFPVKGSSLSSQLSSVPACQSIVKKAIVKRLMHGHKVGTLPEDGALYKVRFALRKDTVKIYLDTSGDGLHKRGYRKNATLAPIKETLAAAIADLGRVRRDSLVQDPFCGSGTLVIESAQKALNLAPGLRRRFAAEHFDFVPASIWAEQRQKALSETGMLSPENRILFIFSGTLYSNPFRVEIMHNAETAHTNVVTSLSIRKSISLVGKENNCFGIICTVAPVFSPE